MRVLVTGADGFVGRHLCPHLVRSGHEVVEVRGTDVDVTEGATLSKLVRAAQPDGIIHLAGFSSVGQSLKDPVRAFAVNALGTVNLLTAALPGTKLLLIASAEVYGAVTGRATEDLPLRPLSPYASSKAAAEIAGFQWHRSNKLHVVSARSFNHLGRGQRTDFVVPAFAEQLRNGADVLRVGNLDPVRDFSHVLDVVEAYRVLLERGVAGEAYNVCSGEGRSIRSLVDRMIELSGREVRVEVDPARVRPADIPALVGDASKLRALGWAPTHSLDDALRDALKG